MLIKIAIAALIVAGVALGGELTLDAGVAAARKHLPAHKLPTASGVPDATILSCTAGRHSHLHIWKRSCVA